MSSSIANRPEDVRFTDDFMFSTILSENKELCMEFIERVLGIKVRDISYIGTQETVKDAKETKGIRLDVYVEDDNNSVFDLEMQTRITGNLPKRSRYYQSMIDRENLGAGKDYNDLKDSYVVFICLKDLFGRGLSRYTFTDVCEEDKNLLLGDGRKIVFINASGDRTGISKELSAVLDYLLTGKPEDDYTAGVESAVRRKAESPNWWRNYMTLEMKYQEYLKEGRAEGRVEGRVEGENRASALAVFFYEDDKIDITAQKLGVNKEKLRSIKAKSSSVEEMVANYNLFMNQNAVGTEA